MGFKLIKKHRHKSTNKIKKALKNINNSKRQAKMSTKPCYIFKCTKHKK